jgi:hypothetical protein
LRLLGTAPGVELAEQALLSQEARELTRIFSAILIKTEPKRDS